MYKHASISDLLGKTIKQITGLEAGSNYVDFECEDGSLFRMDHQQDCSTLPMRVICAAVAHL
ncbi:hypothetical protein [Pseudomonas aeruginosa]|uniref:hypothetical protein n=1 Tax=Pseudomonas aeruginosa TaxID=287 RepID=UPI001EDA1176|nr:hypothetical protein [Pseudomonas aeruginosa]MCG3032558.1 hypothetical protein [Pseudomonas aeruginosa]